MLKKVFREHQEIFGYKFAFRYPILTIFLLKTIFMSLLIWWGSTVSRLQRHYEETIENSALRTLRIQHLNHQAIAPIIYLCHPMRYMIEFSSAEKNIREEFGNARSDNNFLGQWYVKSPQFGPAKQTQYYISR